MTKVYRDYTADELAVQLNVEATIDNFAEYQQRNGADTMRARQAVPCKIDIAYGPEELNKLDIYWPKAKKAGGYPVMFDIHGGGWRAGSKNGRGYPAESLVPKGLVWVTIDYGLAPAYKVDQIVDHVRRAFAWTVKNISEYGGDPNRIYVGGHSAGGHLTGMLLMDGRHATYGVPEGTIKGAIASSGVFDMEALVGATEGFNDQLGMTKDVARAHSPYHHLPKKAPPLIVTYGGAETDEFRRQSIDFAKACKEAGFSVELIEAKGDNHFSIARTAIDPASLLNRASLKMLGL